MCAAVQVIIKAEHGTLLSAAVQRYREAGRLKAIGWGASALLVTAALAFTIAGEPSPVIGIIGAVYLVCSRVVLGPETTAAHREGVTLQEQFDVAVFGLPWNAGIAGEPMSPMDVADLARSGRGAELAATWYVDIRTASLAVRTLLGQFENVAWGRRDHRRFAVGVTVVTVASVAVTVALGIIEADSLATYLSGLAVPVLPWTLDLVDLGRAHRRAAAVRGRIETSISQLLQGSGGHPPSTSDVRRIQDEIFAARRDFGRVPAWFYRIYRSRNESAFSRAAGELTSVIANSHAA